MKVNAEMREGTDISHFGMQLSLGFPGSLRLVCLECRLEDELIKTFPEEAGQAAKIAVYGEYVEKTDGLLLKSLELADVHAEVLRRLARHKRHAAF
jgi:hypothetical protein